MANAVIAESNKIIDKIQSDIDTNGIQVESIINDLKELRVIAIDTEQPRLAMALRLTCEHLDENEGFMIPIPEEIEVDDEGNEVGFSEQDDLEEDEELQKESLKYLLAIMSDLDNKANYAELKDYNVAFKDY